MVIGDDACELSNSKPEEDTGDDLMAISANAVQGTNVGHTVRMIGDIYGREAIILVDSGSSNSFISESLASKWRSWSTLQNPMQVRVANGETL